MSPSPHVRRLALARFLSLAGGEGTFVVGIWGRAAFEFGAGPAELAPVLVVLGVAALAGILMAGPLIDRFDPRRVLLAGEILTVPAALALLLPSSLAGLTAGVALWGLIHGLTGTATTSFAPYLSSDEDGLGRANAVLDMAGSTALVAGSAMAAVVAGAIGVSAVFVLDAAGSLIAAWMLRGVAVRQMDGARERISLGEVMEGFRFAAASPLLVFALALGALQWLLYGVFSVFEPLFFRDALGEGPETLGLVNTLFGVGLIAGAALFGRLGGGWATARGVTWLVVATGLGAVAYTAVADLRAVTMGVLVLGVAIGAGEPAARTLVQSVTPQRLVGRVMAVTNVNESVGELLPPLVIPALAIGWSAQATLVGSGLVVAVAGLACLGLARRVDRRAALSDAGMLPS